MIKAYKEKRNPDQNKKLSKAIIRIQTLISELNKKEIPEDIAAI